MGFRSSNKEKREVLRKQLDEFARAQYQAEEDAWTKVVQVLREHEGMDLSPSEIAFLAGTPLTPKEILGNLKVASCIGQDYCSIWSHSHVLNDEFMYLWRYTKPKVQPTTRKVTRHFVETSEDGTPIVGTEFTKTRARRTFRYTTKQEQD